MRIEDVLIIDLEASGLGPGSWPIEVGLAWVEGGAVKSWSSLIRPEPGWDRNLWDMFAQDVHGILLSDLEGAPTAWSVAEELLDRVAGRPVYSDAPSYDLRWVRRLLDAHPSEAGIRILDYDRAVGAVCGEHGANWAYERLERTRTPHRAGPDAARMMEAILYGIGRSSAPAEPGPS
jgi:DNA polymerase III subunit epsilon